MSYVYPYIFLTRQGNTLTIEAIMLYSRCGRVVYGARHKAKRLVLQCINGVSLNPPHHRHTNFPQEGTSNLGAGQLKFTTRLRTSEAPYTQ